MNSTIIVQGAVATCDTAKKFVSIRVDDTEVETIQSAEKKFGVRLLKMYKDYPYVLVQIKDGTKIDLKKDDCGKFAIFIHPKLKKAFIVKYKLEEFDIDDIDF